LEQIIAVGISIGHPTHHWNPKISSYTYGVQNGNHVIDLVKTRIKMEEARQFIEISRREGKDILFVGTSSQAEQVIEERARASQSFFVKKRWLGGILTNWSTVQISLLQLHRLERQHKQDRWISLPKKERSLVQKRLEHLTCYLGGLKGIRALPGVVVVVGQIVESVAIQECRKLGIPIVCSLDTNCDPSLVDIGVPINDDSTARIRLFLETLVSGIQEGRKKSQVKRI
jgi:small subunit ribosomal protein S2